MRLLAWGSLSVVWTIEGNPNPYETAPRDGSLSGSVSFLIPVAVVAASQGKRVTVHYFVGRGSNPGVPSESLALSVRVLGQEHLPVPVVPEASGGAIYLSRLPGDASVTVQAWPLIAAGQRYWISVQGTLEDGTPRTFYVATGQVVNQAQVGAGLNHPILRRELQRFGRNSTLTVTCSVTFDGSANQENAWFFPALPLWLLPDQDYEDFSSLSGKIYVGSSISLRFMRLYVTGDPGGHVLSNYWTVNKLYYISSIARQNALLASIVNLELNYVASSVYFQFWGSANITLRNQSDQVIFFRRYDNQDDSNLVPVPISITVPGERIKTIVMEGLPYGYGHGLLGQFRVTY
jgi:hypothetical protein